MTDIPTFFSNDSEKLRNIILGDIKQTPPTGDLKVIDATKKALNNGSDMFILTLERDSGEKVLLNCFERDLKSCVAEWGVGHPVETWGSVHFEKNMLGTRWTLKPSPLQVIEEDVI